MSLDGWTALPDPRTLRPLVGSETALAELDRRIQAATALAWSSTRGRGFSTDRRRVHPDIALVIGVSVVRSLTNPALPLALAAPAFSGRPGTFPDWSLAEAATLERVRCSHLEAG